MSSMNLKGLSATLLRVLARRWLSEIPDDLAAEMSDDELVGRWEFFAEEALDAARRRHAGWAG